MKRLWIKTGTVAGSLLLALWSWILLPEVPRPAPTPRPAPVAWIEGHVDDRGAPVPDAEVILIHRQAPVLDACPLEGEALVDRLLFGRAVQATLQTRTDGTGSFRIPVAEPGPWLLIARARGRQGVRTQVGPGEGSTAVTLAAMGSVTGRLLDDEGQPEVGAKVALIGEIGGALFAQTALDGTFEFPAEPGLYRVVGWREGAASAMAEALPGHPLELRLGALRTLSGNALSCDGESSAVAIELQAGGCTLRGMADARGYFELRNVPPGQVRFIASDGRWQTRRNLRLEHDLLDQEVWLDEPVAN